MSYKVFQRSECDRCGCKVEELYTHPQAVVLPKGWKVVQIGPEPVKHVCDLCVIKLQEFLGSAFTKWG